MADGEDDVIFERDDMVAIARGGRKESQLTCNKLLVTVILSASFFGLGLCFAIPGPTLLDLEGNTGALKGQISFIFTSRSVGYLLGSVVGGFLFDHLNQPCLLSIFMIVTGLATAIAPWCRQLAWLAAMIMLQGVSMGFLDTGGNLMCLETWGRDNGPHMQSLHFSFGIGAFLAPLLSAPFLHNDSSQSSHADDISSYWSTSAMDENTTVATINANITSTTTSTTTSTITSTIAAAASPVKYAYLIVAIYVCFVSLGFIMLFFCNRKSTGFSKSAETLKSEYTVRPERLSFRIQMLALMFIFYFLYVGMEVTYGSLVSKFAVRVYHWDKQKAAFIASVFWGSFATGRFLAIFLARCFNPTPMLIADLVLSTVSLLGLAAVEKVGAIADKGIQELLFWILSGVLGFGFASIFPTGITWVERYMKVTGRAAAVFVVGSALGEMVLPVLTGFLFDLNDPMWLMYVLLFASFISIVVYVVMVNVACSVGERYDRVANLSEDMQPLRLAEDDGVSLAPGDFPNGHDASDRKKRVTFVLNSESSLSLNRDGVSSKGSILRSKSVQKKD